MAKKILKQKALNFRKQGMSYSEIKIKLGVSKSTLSLWLRDIPLSKEKIDSLQGHNPVRIERFRNTMNEKRNEKISKIYELAKQNLKIVSKRDLLIGGIFLYMGEGSKTTKGTTALTNTNPKILKLFVQWLKIHKVKNEKIKVQLHLYSDMNIKKQVVFWSDELGIPSDQFRKPHIKKSASNSISYKGGYGQGTCTVLYEDVELHYLTLMYIRYIQENYLT